MRPLRASSSSVYNREREWCVQKSRRPARAGLRASEVRRCLLGEVRTEGSRPAVAFSVWPADSTAFAGSHPWVSLGAISDTLRAT